jgi:galactonate dehydratase
MVLTSCRVCGMLANRPIIDRIGDPTTQIDLSHALVACCHRTTRETPLPIKITSIQPIFIHVNHRGDWVFLLVHTDAGITGLGEASHSGNDALLLETVRAFTERLVGRSPLQIEGIWHQLARVDGGRISHTALSGIEQALWDIAGQHLGVPIHALLGGAVRDRLRLYANINRHVTDRSPEGFARAARQAVDEGFTAVKLAPFDELRGRDHVRTGPDAAWRKGVKRVQAVRAAIGDSVDLAVDCHGRMEPSEAIAVGRALADSDLLWYEEPVPHRFVDELARVSQAVPMPTASAESVFALEGFRPFLTRHIVDVVMPDVKHDGGLLETKNIASAARMTQLLVAPHNPSGPVATIATGHVMSTASNFFILEYAWGEVDWRSRLLTPAEPIRDGYLYVSQAPGLGHRLAPDLVKEHHRAVANSSDSTRVVVEPTI